MTEEQFALETTLKNSLPEVVIVQLDFKSSSEYKALLRCKFEGNFADGIKSFIEKFSTETNTNWIVRQTFPKLVKLVFRKVFVCHHSRYNKKKEDPNLTNRNLSRNKDCNAQIDIKIKKHTKYTIRRDSYLKNGLNGQIKISFNHSHRIEAAEALSSLRMSSSTREAFFKYFDDGLSPCAAKNFHESIIKANSSDENELISTLANTGFNPTDRQVYYLYDKWRSKNLEAMMFKEIPAICVVKPVEKTKKDELLETEEINILAYIKPDIEEYEESKADIVDIKEESLNVDTNKTVTEEEVEENIVVEDEPQHSGHISSKSEISQRKKSNKSHVAEYQERVRRRMRLDDVRQIKRRKVEEEDDVDLFMKSIKLTVKKLPPALINEAKLGILTLVNNLELKAAARIAPQ